LCSGSLLFLHGNQSLPPLSETACSAGLFELQWATTFLDLCFFVSFFGVCGVDSGLLPDMDWDAAASDPTTVSVAESLDTATDPMPFPLECTPWVGVGGVRARCPGAGLLPAGIDESPLVKRPRPKVRAKAPVVCAAELRHSTSSYHHM
jgi:hypothetical protein